MTFSYAAGSATPDWFGSIEWPDLLMSVDGSFQPLYIPPLFESAPLRVPQANAPRGGWMVGDPLLDGWQFDVRARILVSDAADIQGAFDYLRQKVNADLGWQTVNVKGHGWSAAQTMTLMLAGQIQPTTDPGPGEVTAPEREITIPLLAADPRRYGTPVAYTVTMGGVSVTNAGTTPSPFVVRFNGPLPDPVTINGPGTGNLLGITGGLSSGEWVEVTTVDPSTGSLTAVDDTGADAFARVSGDGSVAFIRTGNGTWTKSGGTGTVTLTVSPAYA